MEAPTTSSVEAGEGLFERLHARLGDRYLTVLLFSVIGSITSLGAAFSLLMIPYLHVSLERWASLMLLILPYTALLGGAAAIAHGRVIEPLRSWVRAGQLQDGAALAWDAAVPSLPRAVGTGGGVMAIGAIPLSVYVSFHSLGLGTAGMFGVIAAFSVMTVVGTALHYLLWERAMRPVVLQIATQLPPDFRTEKASLSLSTRLLMLVPILNVLTAFLAVGLAREGLSSEGRIFLGLVVAGAITIAVALPLTLMLRRSLLDPMGMMLEAMGRVEQGDLDAALPVTTADELGTVAQHFNSMLKGLKERERLSGENTRLQAEVLTQLDQVRASRERIIAASDAERRRVERNIHDGAQQQLVALALELRMLEARAKSGDQAELGEGIEAAGESLSQALAELRELARGLHPQILTTSGLVPALRQLAGRAPVPVSLDTCEGRFPDQIESTAYFVASEALANVAKYSQASEAQLSVEARGSNLIVAVVDDGIGGADAHAGSGLAGLADRVAAVGGELRVEGEPGEGTRVIADLPLEDGER